MTEITTQLESNLGVGILGLLYVSKDGDKHLIYNSNSLPLTSNQKEDLYQNALEEVERNCRSFYLKNF